MSDEDAVLPDPFPAYDMQCKNFVVLRPFLGFHVLSLQCIEVKRILLCSKHFWKQISCCHLQMIRWNWNWSGRMFDYHGRHVCSLWKFEVSCCDMDGGSSSQCCGAHCSPSWSSAENQTTLLSPAPPVPAQRSKAKPEKLGTASFSASRDFSFQDSAARRLAANPRVASTFWHLPCYIRRPCAACNDMQSCIIIISAPHWSLKGDK